MLRWPFKKKTPESEQPAGANGAAMDEWAYLRSRPDHDEEEMSGVHRRDEPARPGPARPAPGPSGQAAPLDEVQPSIFSGEELRALTTIIPPGMETVGLTDEDRMLADLAREAFGSEPGGGERHAPESGGAGEREGPSEADLLDLALTRLERDGDFPQSGRTNS
jgi:hypothetical protein